MRSAALETARTFQDAAGLIEHTLRTAVFSGASTPPITCTWRRGRGNFVLVIGDNASGKSFFRRVATVLSREASVEPIHLSMEGRATGGFERAMLYGDEKWQSTGAISAQTMLMGIKTCRAREKPHMIFFDEPDLGLSDPWAAGMGESLRAFAGAMPEFTRAAFVVTHNRALVYQLVDAEPHVLFFGGRPPRSLTHWLEGPIKPRNIEKLGELSRKRFKAIGACLNATKKNKR
jgi:hypothetical protein